MISVGEIYHVEIMLKSHSRILKLVLLEDNDFVEETNNFTK